MLDARRITAGRLRHAGPALAPVPVRRWLGMVQAPLLAVPAVRDRGRWSCHLERLRLCQGALALPSVAGPRAIRPFASGNAQWDALCFVGFTPCGCYPLSYRRRIVLHLRVDPLPGVPLLRIARAFLRLGSAFQRFDVWRMRALAESGKTGSVALIHFRHKGQWTRVDKSTPHRKPGGCSSETALRGRISACGRAGPAGGGAAR